MKRSQLPPAAVCALLALLACMLLAGCQTAPAAQDVLPALEDAPDETPQAEYPWEAMQIEPAPSAEDYFSQTVVYDPFAFAYEPAWLVSSGTYLSGYCLKNDEDGFRLYQNETCIAAYYPQPVALYRMSPGYLYFCTASAIFRADYGGKHVEKLFDAEADTLAEVYEAEDVLFFAVQSASGYAIYRLYAPEGKLELLYDGIPAETQGFSLSMPISNNEIVWTYTNPDFLALAEAHWSEYQEEFDLSEADYTSTYYGMIELDFDQYSAVRCYYNAATGQFAQQDYGYVYLTPQRTEENIEKNGDAWWKDEALTDAPWTGYTAPEHLRYDEYFSVEREYAVSAFGEGQSDTVCYDDPLPVWWPEDKDVPFAQKMRIRNEPDGSLGLNWKGEAYTTWWPDAAEVSDVCLTSEWVYLAVGDTLYRVRPSGAEQQTIHQFEDGHVQQVLVHKTDDVAFLLVKTGADYAIWRYYGPSGELDLLHEIVQTPEPVDLSLDLPASNQAVVWSQKNPEFVQLAQQLYASYLQTNPEVADAATGRTVYYGLLEREQFAFSGLSCYLNCKTGEYRELLSSCVYSLPEKTGTAKYIADHPDWFSTTLRTQADIDANGPRWWQDELAE